jgi:hypothetical protein
MPMKNVKEENVAHTDADSSLPTRLAASDLQEPQSLASRKDDATDWVFADLPLSNKTPPRDASNLMELEDYVTFSLELAHNLFHSSLKCKPGFSVQVYKFAHTNI